MPGRRGPRRYCCRVPYTVTTPVFEGPFDLLLHLITRQQVDLWEVSISDIVDAYVTTLVDMRAGLDLETATEFLLIASVLLELKARRLLPGRDDVEPEEELALWEERDMLLARLLECKTFKDAAAALHRIMEKAGRSYPRMAGSRSSRPSRRPGCSSTTWPRFEQACETRSRSSSTSFPAPVASRSSG